MVGLNVRVVARLGRCLFLFSVATIAACGSASSQLGASSALSQASGAARHTLALRSALLSVGGAPGPGQAIREVFNAPDTFEILARDGLPATYVVSGTLYSPTGRSYQRRQLSFGSAEAVLGEPIDVLKSIQSARQVTGSRAGTYSYVSSRPSALGTITGGFLTVQAGYVSAITVHFDGPVPKAETITWSAYNSAPAIAVPASEAPTSPTTTAVGICGLFAGGCISSTSVP